MPPISNRDMSEALIRGPNNACALPISVYAQRSNCSNRSKGSQYTNETRGPAFCRVIRHTKPHSLSSRALKQYPRDAVLDRVKNVDSRKVVRGGLLLPLIPWLVVLLMPQDISSACSFVLLPGLGSFLRICVCSR